MRRASSSPRSRSKYEWASTSRSTLEPIVRRTSATQSMPSAVAAAIFAASPLLGIPSHGASLMASKPASIAVPAHFAKAARRAVVGRAVDVRVIAKFHPQPPAQQVAGRRAEQLAPDIPKRVLESAHRHRRRRAALRDHRFRRGAQAFDFEDAASLDELEELAQQRDPGFVAAPVRGVADSRHADAGLNARYDPVPAPVHRNAEDLEPRHGDLGGLASSRRRNHRRSRPCSRAQALQHPAPAKRCKLSHHE